MIENRAGAISSDERGSNIRGLCTDDDASRMNIYNPSYYKATIEKQITQANKVVALLLLPGQLATTYYS